MSPSKPTHGVHAPDIARQVRVETLSERNSAASYSFARRKCARSVPSMKSMACGVLRGETVGIQRRNNLMQL